jgi:hypothetical protein
LIAGSNYGTALQIALDLQNMAIITLLLEKAADVNAEGTSFVIPRIFS